MRILFITDLYPVQGDEKTTPKTLYNFVEEWKKLGHTVDIIKPNFIFNSFLRKKPFYKTGKYGDVYNINFWTPFWFDIKNKFNFSNDYDLVIAHMPSGILFADKLGVPFVAGIHNSDLKVLTKPIYKLFGKKHIRALKNAKAIACRSYVIKAKLLKLFPEFENKTFVAPSGIDENIIQEPLNCQFDRCTKILTCANLKKRKNIDKLIQACKDLNEIELKVVGDGEIKKQLENLDSTVKYTGMLNSQEVLTSEIQLEDFLSSGSESSMSLSSPVTVNLKTLL